MALRCNEFCRGTVRGAATFLQFTAGRLLKTLAARPSWRPPSEALLKGWAGALTSVGWGTLGIFGFACALIYSLRKLVKQFRERIGDRLRNIVLCQQLLPNQPSNLPV